MNHLVVGCYQEPLDWLDRVSERWTVHVVRNGVDRPNEGREGAAYIWWLTIGRKGPLYSSDLVAFAQGNPFDHCADFLDRLEATPDDLNGYRPLIDPHRQNWPLRADGAPDYPGLPVETWFRWVIGRPMPSTFQAHGQFATRAGRLIANRFLLTKIAALLVGNDPIEGHLLERSWETLCSS